MFRRIALFLLFTAFAGADSLRMTGDSLVLAGVQPGVLTFDQLIDGSVQVRSTYDPAAPESVVYEEGKDYVVDAVKGSIARTETSRIPDFSKNVLYGQKEFDHTKFPGYGNKPFFVYVDYATSNGSVLAPAVPQPEALKKTRARLDSGGPLKILTYGDSISAGGEASSRALCFDERYAAHLREQFPKATITVENGATGGDATPQGLARLEEKVLTREPDLVLVGFGMNDHNVNSVEPGQFEDNLVSIVTQIQQRTGAEVILFSAFPPNPDWKHSSHRMEQYAAATKRAAERTASAYADVFGVWQRVLQRKDLPSLLANNINHPNDFGHWLYFEGLKAVGF